MKLISIVHNFRFHFVHIFHRIQWFSDRFFSFSIVFLFWKKKEVTRSRKLRLVIVVWRRNWKDNRKIRIGTKSDTIPAK